MKIGIEIDFQRKRFSVPVERVQLADRLGYDMCFAAEANGSDAFTALGFVAGVTSQIGLGTRIVQTMARTPAATAMGFMTLQHMAPDRTILAGLGSVADWFIEGWHGHKWNPPYWRMRDYVAIMRKAFNGDVVEHEGRTINIPYREPGEKPKHSPMKPTLDPCPDIRILFGGGTPTMLTLAAEIADGLLPNGSWSPGLYDFYRPMIEKGLAKRGSSLSADNFPIWAHVDVLVTHDVKGALAQFKEYVARYAWKPAALGTQMVARGYGEARERCAELYLAGRIAEAEAAVPDEYIEEFWLIGPLPRIVERWRTKWINDGCNLIVRTDNWPSAKPANNDVYEPLLRALRD